VGSGLRASKGQAPQGTVRNSQRAFKGSDAQPGLADIRFYNLRCIADCLMLQQEVHPVVVHGLLRRPEINLALLVLNEPEPIILPKC